MEHDRNVLFQGAIPGNYDRYLGPVIFEPWAEDLVARLAGKKYERVLEIACGTGIGAMRESYRVLRNGGVFLFNVWDCFKANPFGANCAHNDRFILRSRPTEVL